MPRQRPTVRPRSGPYIEQNQNYRSLEQHRTVESLSGDGVLPLDCHSLVPVLANIVAADIAAGSALAHWSP